MNPATVQLMLTLLQSTPALIGFAQSTFNLFQNGKITESELADLWKQAGEGVQAEIARWNAIKTPA